MKDEPEEEIKKPVVIEKKKEKKVKKSTIIIMKSKIELNVIKAIQNYIIKYKSNSYIPSQYCVF